MTLKKNDLAELKKAGLKAINDKIHELKLELARTKLELARKEIKNVAAPRLLRRDLARLLTVRQALLTQRDTVSQ